MADAGRRWQTLADASRCWQDVAESGRGWQRLADASRAMTLSTYEEIFNYYNINYNLRDYAII